MIGLGIAKGLGVTLKHFAATYIEDIKYFLQKPDKTIMDYRMDPHSAGIYTMQYPEEKPHIPENFRFLPFLVTDYEGAEFDQRSQHNRCTSCGICAKACPPQCIWIVRTTDASGKPIPQPKEFYIDTDICMNCGYCAEFCPFDAIIMDHEYALADYARDGAMSHIHDLNRLMKPASYYKNIRPTHYQRLEQERIAAEEEKRRKEEEKAKQAAARQTAAPRAKAEAVAAEKIAPPEAKPKRTPEEIKAQREAMMAKKQAQASGQADTEAGKPAAEPAAEVTPAPAAAEDDKPAAAARPKRTPAEIQAQREAMMAKKRAKESGES
jgi:NADH-quinone oxidoreductase subunit I